MHLGLAVSPTADTRAMGGLAAGLTTHARTHLLLGTSRTGAGRRPTGGRTRVLQVRALMVSLLLLVHTEQAMIVRDAVALLTGLHPSTKYRLGNQRGEGTRRRRRRPPPGHRAAVRPHPA